MPDLRIRTLTVGVNPNRASDHAVFEVALEKLRRTEHLFQDSGFEIQTVRIATAPLAEYSEPERDFDALLELDRIANEAGILLGLGPVDPAQINTTEFGAWAAKLISSTSNTSFSVDSDCGDRSRIEAAAQAVIAIAKTSAGGEGNFRFAAAAGIPASTPFFPVAYSGADDALSIGLEFPNLLLSALDDPSDWRQVEQRLITRLDQRLSPVADLGRQTAENVGLRFAGVDLSPAPGLDCSIADVLETVMGAPFGSALTLSACALITGALKKTNLPRCGYSGLFLPILEDRTLAQRAAERRFTVKELLLYSTVCGAGLDLVPLPGDIAPAKLESLILDVATLSDRLAKPLSARLLPMPGYKDGDKVSFDNPYLTDAAVMALD